MAIARSDWPLSVPTGLASRVWTDVDRWANFVDGFGHVLDVDESWPEVGSTVVWQSGPAGRGRVTERIVERDDDHVVTEVSEDQLKGVQAVFFEPGRVLMQLDYQLTKGGPFSKITDALFIRRALAMALERTLQRFVTEADEEAAL